MSHIGGLSTQEQILIEQRVSNEAKSTGVAYLLWFFTGSFGGHRFYLGRTGSAVTMLLMSIAGWLTIIIGVGLLFLVPVGIWALIDGFLIPGMVTKHKAEVRNTLTMAALTHQRIAALAA